MAIDVGGEVGKYGLNRPFRHGRERLHRPRDGAAVLELTGECRAFCDISAMESLV